MMPFGRAEGLRFVGLLGLCAFIGALFCATLGALAHLASAAFAQDLYSIAIGDELLPRSPVDSWFWGPILIGAFVTWWVGTIAAPALFLAAFVGDRPVARPLDFIKAGLGGTAAGAVVLALLMFLESRQYPVERDGWGNVLAASVIQQGYWALATALIAMTAILVLRRRRNPGNV